MRAAGGATSHARRSQRQPTEVVIRNGDRGSRHLRGAEEAYAGLVHLEQRRVRRGPGHTRREVEQHRRLEALALGVEGRRPHAVVGRDADDLDLPDPVIAQPGGERRALALVAVTLEPAVGGGVLTLAE